MNTLIIHPKDPSTDFLKPIYAPIQNKTIVTGGVTKHELRELIRNHERIILLGHGSPGGLLCMHKFGTTNGFIIDHSMVKVLKEKKDNIFIWCNADQFVHRNQLSGFFSGMFISEIIEAIYYDFLDLEQNTIEESNDGFADIVSRHIDQPLVILYENVIQEYRFLAQTNPIARFNFERLYFAEKNMYSCKFDESLY